MAKHIPTPYGPENTPHTLKNVEAGYARVASSTGHTLGYVVREKVGSTRTGTAWMAFTPGRNLIGQRDTREAAAALVVSRSRR